MPDPTQEDLRNNVTTYHDTWEDMPFRGLPTHPMAIMTGVVGAMSAVSR